MRSYFIGAVLVLGVSSPAQAACWNDVLESRHGDLLVLRSGAVYRVMDGPAATSFWLRLARVIICDQVFVTMNGELAAIYEIRNQDANELVRATRER